MADTTSTPDAAGTASRSALLAEFDGGTWTPDDALVLWSFLANEPGAKGLAHVFEFVKKDFLTAVATVMDGNDAREREVLRLIVAGGDADPHGARRRARARAGGGDGARAVDRVVHEAEGRSVRRGCRVSPRPGASAARPAEHYYERSREVSQKNGHDAGTARAFGALGVLRMNKKDYDHADWYFKTASKLFEDAGQERASTRMLERQGWNLCLKDDISEGRSQLSRALARYANAGVHEEAKRLREEMAEFGLSA